MILHLIVVAVTLFLVSPANAVVSGGAQSSKVGSSTLRTVDDFADFLGVCAHVGRTSQESVDNISRMAAFMKAKHIRSDLVSTTLQVDKMVQINAATGIKFNGLFNDSLSVTYNQQKQAVLDNISIFSAVEGLNEIDGKTLNDPAFSELSNYANYRAWQQRLYSDFHSLVDVYSYTWVEKESLVNNLSSLTPVAADYHAIHYYYFWPNPTYPYQRYNLTKTVRSPMMPTARIVVTESNAYTMATNGLQVGNDMNYAVSDLVQAKHALNNVFVAWNDNARRVFFYELVDLAEDPDGVDREYHFGLFYYSMQPKPAAIALNNLFSVVKGTGSANFVLPQYSTPDLCASCHVAAVQASDALYLALWQDVPLVNTTTREDLSISPVTVTLNIDRSMKASLYDPLTSKNTYSVSLGNSFSLSVPDHVMLVKLEQP